MMDRTITRVGLIGDLHGDVGAGIAAIRDLKDQGANILVQLGDFGFMGQGVDQFIHKLNRTLTLHELDLWWVDGNHENHERLAKFPLDERGLQPIAFQKNTPETHIFHIPRGYRWTWGGVKFLGCGGAYSIDKQWRKEGVSWWPQETITEADIIRCGEDPVDVVISHDTPWGVQDPYGPWTGGGDKDQWPESTANRHRLRAIVDAVRPRLVLHGHVHNRYSEVITLDDVFPVQVEGFACNGMANYYGILDLEALSNHLLP